MMEALTNKGFDCIDGSKFTLAELVGPLATCTGIVIRSRIKLTKAIISSCTQLKFIARFGAGMENIDTAAAHAQGVKCLNAPEGNADAVAEHALGMLLCLLNNILISDKQVRAGVWEREGNRGVELKNKIVGIIGYGVMGRAFSERLIALGCQVMAYDKYLNNFGSKKILEVPLQSIFEEADIVSLHLPLTDETRYLVNKQFIDAFKKPIILINTSRGVIVNSNDLVNGLNEGKINGACLDVLEYESTSFENIGEGMAPALKAILASNKIILTPHIAGWSQESNVKIAEGLLRRIETLDLS